MLLLLSSVLVVWRDVDVRVHCICFHFELIVVVCLHGCADYVMMLCVVACDCFAVDVMLRMCVVCAVNLFVMLMCYVCSLLFEMMCEWLLGCLCCAV